jgi:hypothetical protein
MKNRVRCVTRRCTGSVESPAADDNWQFQCPSCKFWNLSSREGVVRATSPTPFDLERLSTSVRQSFYVKRSPPGGV